jgi:hypothetical protein
MIPKTGKNVPNGHKTSQMSIKYSKWPYDVPTYSNLRPWNFFLQIGIFGLKPSGNPEDKHTHDGVLQLAMKKMARM